MRRIAGWVVVSAYVVVLLVSVTQSTMATAEERRAIALPTQTAGFIPRRQVWEAEFDERIDQALQKYQFTLISRRALTKKDLDCAAGDPCTLELLRRHEAQVLLRAEVRSDDRQPPSYALAVSVFDLAAPSEARRTTETCALCTEVMAAESLYRLATRALAPPGQEPVSEPPPRAVPPPLNGGTGAAAPPPETRPNHRRTLYWALGGVGAALFVSGVVVTAVEAHADGTPACKGPAPAGVPCRLVEDHRGGIAAGVVIGVVGAALGATFFTLAHREPARVARVQLTPALGVGYAGLSLEGRF